MEQTFTFPPIFKMFVLIAILLAVAVTCLKLGGIVGAAGGTFGIVLTVGVIIVVIIRSDDDSFTGYRK